MTHSPAAAAERIAHHARRHWGLAAVCAGFLLVGALVLDDYGVGSDEGSQQKIGNAALDYVGGGGEHAFGQLYAPFDRYYGAVFAAPFVLVERIPGLDDRRDVWLSRHMLTHLFFLVSGVFCYLLVYRIFNSRVLALAGMVLFVLHPRLYAHSFFNPKDIPFAAMFMIALYLTHRAFRRDTLGAFLLCGAGIGILVNLRIMGIILFAAVLALRGLDLLAASGREERSRILLTAGGFALTAMLTYYASLPALWIDPIGQFTELVGTLSSHPWLGYNLFRGEWLYAPDGPPFDYVPVWVGITTPPAVLLLAALGAIALAWRGLRRPRDVFRNGPPRFGFLLLALPVATVVAVVVLESNVSSGWRHLYFLYAPLLLLAIFGLHQLARSMRGRWMRAGTYALAGAAIAVTAVSMVRVHPKQDNYFTVLVDRTTPERLASRYDLNFSGQSAGGVLGAIAGDHSGRLFVTIRYVQSRWLLHADDRKRFTNTRDFRSGERNFYELRRGQPCPAPLRDGAYVSRIHAVTLDCFVDPVAYFGGLRRAALATEPLVRSTYHIHRNGSELTYLRDGCPAEDIESRFFLHVRPVDADDLPPGRAEYGFDNRDFPFDARIDGNCIAIARLPDYPIASIHTGQLSDAGVHWEAEFTPDGRVIAPATPDPARSDLARARREALASEPLARSVFSVYRDGRALTYLREGCSAEEAAARFFLHVEPVDPDDLPTPRRVHGFENLDFTLARSGERIDGNCVAVARLPAYPIASVRTGQYDGTGPLWEVEFAVPDGE